MCPLLYATLSARGSSHLLKRETGQEDETCVAPISWAVYTRDKAFFTSRMVRRAVSPWRDDGKSELVWTDQDSNLISIINWGRD